MATVHNVEFDSVIVPGDKLIVPIGVPIYTPPAATTPPPVVTHPPVVTPPPVSGGFVLPSTLGVTPGKLITSGVDPHSDLWDPFNAPVYGEMNNVRCLPQNCVLDANGNAALKLANGGGGFMTTLPPKYKRGGAKVGFEFQSGILRFVAQFPGSGKNVYDWPALNTTCCDWQWPQHGEYDVAEGSGGWNGGMGPLGAHYHSSHATDFDFNGVYTDGFHEFVLVRDCAAGWWAIAVDGQVAVPKQPITDTNAMQFVVMGIGMDGTNHGSQLLVKTFEAYSIA